MMIACNARTNKIRARRRASDAVLLGILLALCAVLAAVPGAARADAIAADRFAAPQASPRPLQGSTRARIGPASAPLFVRIAPPVYTAPDDAPPVYSVLDGANGSFAATPFAANGFAATSRGRALDCLTMAIAYEAGQEPLSGQQAVAQVILNRTRVARFPSSVCGVVFEGSQRSTGCQFTFTCDGSIRRRLRDATIEVARMAAASVLAGQAPDWVSGATHYHANYVLPYWAVTGTRVARIGAHIFYRMRGDAGVSSSALLGNEPDIGALQNMARAPASPPLQLQLRREQARARLSPSAPRALFAPWGVPIGAAGAAPPGQN